MDRWIFHTPEPAADVRLNYGPGEFHFGDLRLPIGGQRPTPVVILIHGGFWRAQYGLEFMGHMALTLAEQGWAVWNIEYRRIGNEGGGFPGTLEDVAAATDYLRQMALKYSLDLNRVVAVGHSAGGHLALWLASRARLPRDVPFWTHNPVRLRGVVSLAGVADLRLASELNLSNGVVHELMTGKPEEIPEWYTLADPAQMLPTGIPSVLVHGAGDDNVPLRISEMYHNMAAAAGDFCQIIPIPGAGHFELIDPDDPLFPIVLDSIRELI